MNKKIDRCPVPRRRAIERQNESDLGTRKNLLLVPAGVSQKFIARQVAKLFGLLNAEHERVVIVIRAAKKSK